MNIIIGIIIGISMSLLAFYHILKNPTCKHQWGKYEDWGITFQQKTCKLCGKKKIVTK